MRSHHFTIIFLIAFPAFLIGQLSPIHISRDYDSTYNCSEFMVMNKPGTVSEKQLNYIDCLVRDQGKLSRGLAVLDSLYAVEMNDTLIFQKTYLLAFYKPYDTVYFSMQRQLIAKGYSAPRKYTDLGIFYMNYVAICGTDTSKVKLSRDKRIELLKLSKFYFYKGINDPTIDKFITFMFLPEVENELLSLQGKEFPKLSKSTKFDSITVIAYIPECGEFGGHFEHLKFYKNGNSVLAKFTSDSTFCDGESKRKEPIYIPAQKQVRLSKNILSFDFFKSIELDRTNDEFFRLYVYVNDNPRKYSGWLDRGVERKEYEMFKQEIFK